MTDKASQSNWIEKNPRLALQLTFFILAFVYLWPAACLGVILFLLLTKLLRIQWFWVLGAGVLSVALFLFFAEFQSSFDLSLFSFLPQTESQNIQLIRDLRFYGFSATLFFVYQIFLLSKCLSRRCRK